MTSLLISVAHVVLPMLMSRVKPEHRAKLVELRPVVAELLEVVDAALASA